DTPAAVAIALLEGFERALDIAEILVSARKRRERAVDLLPAEERVALYDEALDSHPGGCNRLVRRLRSRHHRPCCNPHYQESCPTGSPPPPPFSRRFPAGLHAGRCETNRYCY